MKIDGLGMVRGVLEAKWVLVGVDVSVSEAKAGGSVTDSSPPTTPFAPSATPLGLACLWLSADPIGEESRIR